MGLRRVTPSLLLSRARGVVVLLALLASALLAGAAMADRATDPALPADAAAAARAAFLAAELEAAKTGALYLVLEPAAPRLDLKCEGVLLHNFPLIGARFAPPPRSAGPARWPAVAFQLAAGLTEPERPEITPPGADDAGAAPKPAAEPTTPSGGIDFAARQRQEILGRAPARYLLTFTPDLEVSVVGVAATAAVAPPVLWRRLVEGWHRLRRWVAGPTLAPRLTLEIPEDEARRLFLDLQPDIRLLVALP